LDACSSGGEESQPGELTIRVSTHFGLEAISPDPQGTAASHIAPLVYRPLGEQYRDVQVSGAVVSLTPRDPSPRVDVIKHPLLRSAKVEGGRAILELSDPIVARNLALDTPLLDTGPYEQERFEGGSLLLRRRAGAGPTHIEFVNVPTEEEEWRRFLAREVDVLPYASPRHLAHLAGVPSVRILTNQRPATVGLHFRLSNVPDVNVRRAIAMALRRVPIAYVVTGNRDAAVKAPEDLEAAAKALEKPIRLRLLVLDTTTDFQRAALVIEQQLALIDADVDIQVVSQEELRKRLLAGDWDLWVFFGGHDPASFYRYTTDLSGAAGGYSNPAFDAAVKAGDDPTAIAILESDLPSTPLYRIDDGVALDRSFCSDQPQELTDFSWLASVHRCAPGEGP